MPQDLLKIYDGRNNFWQWDTGQKLIVLDNSIDQVHFSNNKMTYAIVKEVYENDGIRICEVPDIMLKTAKPLMAYAYVMEDNQNKTICVVRYSVNARPIPEDYTYEETNRFKDLVDKIEAVEDMIESGEGVKRFANIKEAEQWADESQEVGLIISVKIDSKWIAHIIDSDHSIAKVYDNSDLITYINRLENLIGDEPVADQIKNAIDVLDLENSYESKGTADKILIDAKEYAYKLVEDHTVETQRAIEEEVARAKKEEEALVKTIHQVNDRIGNIEEGTIHDLSNRITGVEAVVDDKITEAISLIMDNPDKAINSINELIDLIKDSSEENIVVDSTLSKEGQAADAKAVGDALNEKQPKGNYLTSDDGNELDNRIKVLEENQVDWNQNDPTAKDYIKNRPFYNSVEEGPITVTYDGVNPIVDAELCAKIWANKRSAKYTVNGVEATYDGLSGTIIDTGWMYPLRAGGAKYYIAARMWSKDSTEIDELFFMRDSDAKHVPGTVSFTSEHEVVHQLDEKFIPDTIARKTDIPAIPAIPEIPEIPEQVQADWNQNDPNAKDYVKNRTHYVDIIGKDATITTGTSYFKMDSSIVSAIYAQRKTAKYICEGKEYAYSEDLNFGWKIVYGHTYLNIDYSYNSLYASRLEGRAEVIYPLSITYRLEKQVVHPLDEKYIPDTIARTNDYVSDNEIIDMLVEEDMLFALIDSTGSILIDENNNILTW